VRAVAAAAANVQTATDGGRESEAATAAIGVVATVAAAQWGLKATERELLPLHDGPFLFHIKSWRALALVVAATNELVYLAGSEGHACPLPRPLLRGGGEWGAGPYHVAGRAALRFRGAAGVRTPVARCASGTVGGGDGGDGGRDRSAPWRGSSALGAGGRVISPPTMSPPLTNCGVNRGELIASAAAPTGSVGASARGGPGAGRGPVGWTVGGAGGRGARGGRLGRGPMRSDGAPALAARVVAWPERGLRVRRAHYSGMTQ